MSEATIQDACVNCRFWRRLPGQWRPGRPKPKEGHCRRYPPVQQGPATEYTVKASDTCEFPVTDEGELCGEFVRKSLMEIAIAQDPAA